MAFDERRGPRGGGGNRGGGGGRFSGQRETHSAVCAECGTETQVPFKPTGDRPVYCRDCFQSKGGGGGRGGAPRGGGGRGGDRGPRELHDATCSKCGTDTQVPFRPSEGRPVYCRDCFGEMRDSRF